LFLSPRKPPKAFGLITDEVARLRTFLAGTKVVALLDSGLLDPKPNEGSKVN
jgi:hypothetical protein